MNPKAAFKISFGIPLTWVEAIANAATGSNSVVVPDALSEGTVTLQVPPSFTEEHRELLKALLKAAKEQEYCGRN